MTRVLLGVGGGIAAFKAAALASQIVQRGAELRVAMTPSATEFVGARTFEGLSGRTVILRSTQVDPDGSAPHIEATKSADVFVVAPGTAGLIARLAAGACSDAVCLAAIALPEGRRRVLCPAMNDSMWRDRGVVRNVETLRALGWEILGPVEGHLAEGYDAIGRMLEPDDILAAILGTPGQA